MLGGGRGAPPESHTRSVPGKRPAHLAALSRLSGVLGLLLSRRNSESRRVMRWGRGGGSFRRLFQVCSGPGRSPASP